MSLRLLAVALIWGFVCTPAMGVVDDEPGARALEEAILVEEGEHDLEMATRLYHRVANDEAAAAQIRTQAWLRLGLCFAKLGRDHDSKEAFREAAKGAGNAAERAKVLLERGPEDEARLRARVNLLLEPLRGQRRPLRRGDMRERVPNAGEARQELQWIGDAAIPLMIEAIEAEQVDMAFVRNVVQQLERRPNDAVNQYLKRVSASGDEALKLAVIQGLAAEDVDPRLAVGFEGFLSDESPEVRSKAIWAAYPAIIDTRRVIDMLRNDGDADVRCTCLNNLVGHDHALRDAELAQSFLPLIGRSLGQTHYDERVAALRALGAAAMLATQPGRRFYLEQLANLRVEAGYFYDGRLATPFTPRQLLQVAMVVGPVIPHPEPVPDKAAKIMALIERCYQQWKGDDVDVESILGLVDFGYDRYSRLSAWVVKCAPPRPLEIARRIEKFKNVQGVASRIAQMNPPAEALAPLAIRLRATAADDDDRTALVAAIVAIGTAEALDEAIAAIEATPDQYTTVAHAAVRVNTDAARAAMPRLLEMGSADTYPRELRLKMLMHLLVNGVTPGREAIAAAYERGMPRYVASNPHLSLLRWAVERSLPEGADLERLFDAALSTRKQTAWGDALVAMDKMSDRANLVAVISRHVLQEDFVRYDALENTISRYPDNAAVRRLAAVAMADSRDEVCTAAVQAMSSGGMTPTPEMYEALQKLVTRTDRKVVSAAARVLAASDDDASLAAVAALLQNDEAMLRQLASHLLARHRPDEALQAIIDSAEKETDLSVLSTFYKNLGECLDHRAVPALLAAMRHSNTGVRKSAAEALAKIREYYDHRDRFEHWIKDFDLREESAAEALLSQAAAKNPKKIRLAAIHSLGTLGVAETLPFLIEMMQDADADIARAAETAVSHINEKLLQKDD